MQTLTFVAYLSLLALMFGCWGMVHRLVSSEVSNIDIRKLKVVQLPNKKGDDYKVAIGKFLEHGPKEYQEYIFINVQVITFYNTQFRRVKSLIEVLYFAALIGILIIFSRISNYGIDVTTENFTRSIYDFVIGGYFIIWFFSLHKMRRVATAVKLDYNRYI